MPNFSDHTPEQRFIGLFVGLSGCGKTCAEASFQEATNPNIVEFLDFDGRIGGLHGASWLTDEQKKKIKYEYYPPRDSQFITKLETKFDGYLMSARIGQPVPQTVCLDSLTSECFAALSYSVPLTHAGSKGRKVGVVPMPSPEDYGVEANATYGILSYMRTVPIRNVICTAHIVPVFSKIDPSDSYSPSVETGEKLSLRDKIAANIGIYFDHVFRFEKQMYGQSEKYFVTFRSALARTSYSWLPEGRHEWTGKNFYEFMQSFKKGEAK